jgi:plastocyanin
MSRRIIVVMAGLAAALVVAGTAFSRAQATPKLVGTVGPGFTIKLTKGGAKVSSLKAGTYLFVIRDKSAIHQFTIEREKGGAFEKSLTSVSFVGTKSAKVKLGRGKWKFYCKPHESSMHGFFTVK